MARQKRVTAPADRVYKSSIPLKQLKFPEPKKRVTYGKQTSKRISRSDQDTLTQMDFVRLNQLIDEDDGDQEDYEDAAEKRQKKRRKTLGDQPSSHSKYHTQTLTQIDSWSSTVALEQEEEDVFPVPSSPRSLGLRNKHIPTTSAKVRPILQSPSRKQSASGNMRPPQTPRKMIPREVPSSQSPETPLSSQCRMSPVKRSPLKEISTNCHITVHLNAKAVPTRHESPKLKIEDTFETSTESQQSHATKTPSKKSSPFKTVRFHVQDDSPKDVAAWPAVKDEHSQVTPTQMGFSRANSKYEILDSDAESEIDEEDGYAPHEEQGEDEQHETCYGNIGAETQIEVEKLLTFPHAEQSQTLDEQAIDDDPERETQFAEIERLSTQHLNSMAARTGNSDVFISIHPEHVASILSQKKIHEFRQWRLPPTVSRIWIYETAPISTLKYMAVIGPEKRQSDILNDDGVGNSEFNSLPSHGPNYAYEILEVYELADPLPWAQLYVNEWLKTPPLKWTWVRPAVLDRLMANLKPPLFIRSATSQDIPAPSATDTEEAEAQLLCTMLQFTEPATHTQPRLCKTMEAKNLACEEPSLPGGQSQTPHILRPSQASTASCSESQISRNQTVPEVVWESPTRPVSSSTPLQLQFPSSSAQDYHESGSLVPYSLSSSQLLTKSQMLPASLLADSVPGPPLFIQDSEDEED